MELPSVPLPQPCAIRVESFSIGSEERLDNKKRLQWSSLPAFGERMLVNPPVVIFCEWAPLNSWRQYQFVLKDSSLLHQFLKIHMIKYLVILKIHLFFEISSWDHKFDVTIRRGFKAQRRKGIFRKKLFTVCLYQNQWINILTFIWGRRLLIT